MTDLSVPQSLLHPLKASVIGFQEEEHDYHFQVEYPDPPFCYSCATVDQLVRFGKKQVKFRDVPMHGKRVSLWVIRRRFLCKSCNSTFTPPIHEMAEDHRMTARCYSYIIKRSLSSTNACVAHDVGGLVEALEWCEDWFSKHCPTSKVDGFLPIVHPMLTSIRNALAAHRQAQQQDS